MDSQTISRETEENESFKWWQKALVFMVTYTFVGNTGIAILYYYSNWTYKN